MKLGTFVGQVFLRPTKEEKKYVLDRVKKIFKEKYSNVNIKTEVTDILTCISVDIPVFNGSNYRLSNGNLIKPSYVKLRFTSEKGYDEAETGKCYEWKEGFKPEYNKHCYSFSIDVIGDEREYRRREISHNVGLRQTKYTYGTELEDLDIKSGLRELTKFLDNMILGKQKKNIL